MLRMSLAGLGLIVLAGCVNQEEARQSQIAYRAKREAEAIEFICSRRQDIIDKYVRFSEGGPEPVCTIPPSYPKECAAGSNDIEHVNLVIDVEPDGSVSNIRNTRDSNLCFVGPAANMVYRWTFEPTPDGFKDRDLQLIFEKNVKRRI